MGVYRETALIFINHQSSVNTVGYVMVAISISYIQSMKPARNKRYVKFMDFCYEMETGQGMISPLLYISFIDFPYLENQLKSKIHSLKSCADDCSI